MKDHITKKQTDLGGKWKLHHNNVWPHVTDSVKFLTKKKTAKVVLRPTYSPDPSPNDFFLHTCTKKVLKRKHFPTGMAAVKVLEIFFNTAWCFIMKFLCIFKNIFDYVKRIWSNFKENLKHLEKNSNQFLRKYRPLWKKFQIIFKKISLNFFKRILHDFQENFIQLLRNFHKILKRISHSF